MQRTPHSNIAKDIRESWSTTALLAECTMLDKAPHLDVESRC